MLLLLYMINLEIISLGSLKEPYLSLVKDYTKRLKPFCRLKLNCLKAKSFNKANQEKAKQMESDYLLKYLSKKDKNLTFLLTEKGDFFDSLEFANWLNNFDAKSLTLVIGGPLGFSKKLKESFKQISLSPLTFPHELAKIILLEQIYRAFSIINKKTYHY
jgi:23S rRNA (pseudouridine1915-N3)-methyltransferase